MMHFSEYDFPALSSRNRSTFRAKLAKQTSEIQLSERDLLQVFQPGDNPLHPFNYF